MMFQQYSILIIAITIVKGNSDQTVDLPLEIVLQLSEEMVM